MIYLLPRASVNQAPFSVWSQVVAPGSTKDPCLGIRYFAQIEGVSAPWPRASGHNLKTLRLPGCDHLRALTRWPERSLLSHYSTPAMDKLLPRTRKMLGSEPGFFNQFSSGTGQWFFVRFQLASRNFQENLIIRFAILTNQVNIQLLVYGQNSRPAGMPDDFPISRSTILQSDRLNLNFKDTGLQKRYLSISYPHETNPSSLPSKPFDKEASTLQRPCFCEFRPQPVDRSRLFRALSACPFTLIHSIL